MGSSWCTQWAIFRLFAPTLLFSHLCLYLSYILFCVHSSLSLQSFLAIMFFALVSEDCRLLTALVVHTRFVCLCVAIYSICLYNSLWKENKTSGMLTPHRACRTNQSFKLSFELCSVSSIWSSLPSFTNLSWSGENWYKQVTLWAIWEVEDEVKHYSTSLIRLRHTSTVLLPRTSREW